MNLKDNINIVNNFVILKVKIVPNSNKNELFSILSDWVFKIRIKQIPENWKANIELIKFLSEELWINKKQIKILSWNTQKIKIIKIDF